MSRRWVRILIALYPRRWRRRYGAELQQLISEINAERPQSRLALAADLLTAAAAQRIPRLGLRSASAVLLIAAALGVTVALLASRSPLRLTAAARPSRSLAAQIAALRTQVEYSICTTATPGTTIKAVLIDPASGRVVAELARPCARERTYG
jgi:hypothetical protein